jgi:serine protease
VTVVVAAGNDAVDASQVFPASCSNVITVAASDYRGHLVSRYSNFGNTVEIMAPGGDVLRDDNADGSPDGVLSMVHPTAGTYARYNGTSMAAPHVAGVSALFLAQDPSLTPAQVLSKLEDLALPRTTTECPQPCGAGLLSAVQPPPQTSLSLVLDPDKKLDVGETTTARATVTQGGAPKAGETVTFSSQNSTVASVSPTTGVTDSNGVAESTVKGEDKGSTTVKAVTDGAEDSRPVKVPDLSVAGFILLVAIFLIFGVMGRRRNQA